MLGIPLLGAGPQRLRGHTTFTGVSRLAGVVLLVKRKVGVYLSVQEVSHALHACHCSASARALLNNDTTLGHVISRACKAAPETHFPN